MKTIIAIFLSLSIVPGFGQSIEWKVYTTETSGIPSNWVYNIKVDPGGKKWACTDQGLSVYNDTVWTTYNTTNSLLTTDYILDIDFSSNGTAWIVPNYGGIISFDGTNWQIFNTENSGMPTNIAISVLVENGGPGSGGAIWIGTFGYGIVRYDGTSWITYTYPDLPDPGIRSMVLENNGPASGGLLWVGTGSGLAYFDGVIWDTIGLCSSCSNIINALAIENGGPSNNEGSIWLGTAGGEFMSYDGSNWDIYNFATVWMPNEEITSIIVDNDNVKWFGTIYSGLNYFGNNGFNAYDTLNSDIPNQHVYNIDCEYNINNKSLWIATSNGLAELIIPDLNNIEVNYDFEFSLNQNFPNPFVLSTNISFCISEDEIVNLSVYDYSGKYIKTLINNNYSYGNYNYQWIESELPSGIYFYRLKLKNSTITRKCILMK